MGTHPIFESDFDCLTEVVMTRKYNAGLYIGKSIPGFPQRAADLEESLRGIEAACVEERMSADKLTPEEKAAFPAVVANAPKKARISVGAECNIESVESKSGTRSYAGDGHEGNY